MKGVVVFFAFALLRISTSLRHLSSVGFAEKPLLDLEYLRVVQEESMSRTVCYLIELFFVISNLVGVLRETIVKRKRSSTSFVKLLPCG